MGVNDNETILNEKEKAEAKAEAEKQVYTKLSDDIQHIVDDLKDGTDDSQSLNKMKNLSSRLDQGFYNYCETTFGNQRETILNSINSILQNENFSNNPDLKNLQQFVTGKRTVQDNTTTREFTKSRVDQNRSKNIDATTKQQIETNMKKLEDSINALPDNTNLKKLLTAMNDVAKSSTGEGTQSLQFFLYSQLTATEQKTFLEKNIKGTLKPKLNTYNNENTNQDIFDGMKGKNTMLTFINVANNMIKNYNTNKQDIDASNRAFQVLLGSNGNESYITDAQKEIEAEIIKKKEAAQEQADIQQQLQGMDDFINSFSSAKFKEDGTITQAQRNAMAEKNVNFQSKYGRNATNDEINTFYKQVLAEEKIKTRCDKLQGYYFAHKINAEQLKTAGFELNNNKVVLSNDFKKKLKEAGLYDKNDIDEDRSNQRTEREKTEKGLIKQLSELPLVQKCANYLKKRYELQGKTTADGNSIKQEIKDQWIQNLDVAAERDGTLAQIKTLEGMGIEFNIQGKIKNLKNGADWSKIQTFIEQRKASTSNNKEGDDRQTDRQTDRSRSVELQKPEEPPQTVGEKPEVPLQQNPQITETGNERTQETIPDDMTEAQEKEIISKLTEQEKKQYETIKQEKGLRLANNVTEEIIKKFLIIMKEETRFKLDDGRDFVNTGLEELQTGKDYYLINDNPNYSPIIRYNPKNTGTILGIQIATNVNGKQYYNKFTGRSKERWGEE